MKPKVVTTTLLCFIFSMCHLTLPVFAQEADLATLVRTLQKQMTELKSVVATQDAELKALKSRGANIQMAPQNAEASAPMSESEFKQRLSDATGGADKWLKDLKFTGDLRLRYEAFNLGTSANNGYEPYRNRFRFRLRFGFEKKLSDELKAGFSLASGEKAKVSGSDMANSDPISTNQTMTNDFSFKSIWIEKAYATYTPNWAKVNFAENTGISGLEITAGKFNNPFERGSTDMIWDRDLKPEGVYEKVDINLFKTPDVTVKAYGTAGQFVLKETGNSGGKDANLFAFQAGLNPVFYVPGMERPVDSLSALSVYNYQNYAQSNNWSIVGQSQANGNLVSSVDTTSLDAGQFNVLNFYQEIAVYPYGIPFRPFFEFAKNLDDKGMLLTGNEDLAWSTGITLGKLQKKGDWQASYQYKWIGANSVPGAFNDSDFGGYNYGGTNKAGSVIKLGYNLTNYLTLNGACFLVSPIAERSSTANGFQLDEAVRRFQLDMTYKF